jgi:hypothetical protein
VIGEGWELRDGRVNGEAEAAAEEGRRRASVGRSGEGFVLGWGRGAPVGSGEARQGVEESREGLMMAAHGEQGRRRPWHAEVQFEEAEEGRKEEEDESKRARECAGLNRRRRRIRHGTAGGKRWQVRQKKKQKRKQSGMHLGTFLQLQKIQGPHCKPRFPTILEFQ